MQQQQYRGLTSLGEWKYGTLSPGGPFIAYFDPTGFFQVLVKEETIGQCTGAHDGSGRNIFKDDVVEYDHEDGVVIAKVVFQVSNDETLWLSGFKLEVLCTRDYAGEDEAVNFKVLGNIHENPQYLEM